MTMSNPKNLIYDDDLESCAFDSAVGHIYNDVLFLHVVTTPDGEKKSFLVREADPPQKRKDEPTRPQSAFSNTSSYLLSVGTDDEGLSYTTESKREMTSKNASTKNSSPIPKLKRNKDLAQRTEAYLETNYIETKGSPCRSKTRKELPKDLSMRKDALERFRAKDALFKVSSTYLLSIGETDDDEMSIITEDDFERGITRTHSNRSIRTLNSFESMPLITEDKLREGLNEATQRYLSNEDWNDSFDFADMGTAITSLSSSDTISEAPTFGNQWDN